MGMIIVMKESADHSQISAIKDKVESLGYVVHEIKGVLCTVIAAVGDKDKTPLKGLSAWDGVDKVVPVREPYKLASRSTQGEDTVVKINDTRVGGKYFSFFVGPCSVETEEQTLAAAKAAHQMKCQFFRGGAYKPRTSPYSFQGLEEDGLKILKKARDMYGVSIITELIQPSQAELVAEYVDVIQVGARNMQNFPLLKEIGKLKTPVFLKRGLSATLEELLMAAEYIMSEGNRNVILCERGIRTFEKSYRNTLDLNAVPTLQKMTHLPVVVDPSHGTGVRELVPVLAKAAIAAGANGLMIEIHPNPDQAWSDGAQSLPLDQFESLIKDLAPHIELAGKVLG